MKESFEDTGQLLYFPGCEPKVANALEETLSTVAEEAQIATRPQNPEMQGLREQLTAREGHHDKNYYEERPANEIRMNKVFESALLILKRQGSQSRLHIYFLHPSTQSQGFSERVKNFISHSGAADRLSTEFYHGHLCIGGATVEGQNVNGYTLENYYYF